VNGQHRVLNAAVGGVVAAQIGQRFRIRGVAGDLAVDFVVVQRSVVDRVPIVEGVAAGALGEFLDQVRDEYGGAGQVAIALEIVVMEVAQRRGSFFWRSRVLAKFLGIFPGSGSRPGK
jgi:hypothetical protein